MKFKLPLTLFCLFLVSCEKGDVEVFDSRPIFSSSLSGKWVLVNYWADWCPPCIKEIPEIVSFSKKYPEVKVFAFNFDRLDAEELRPQIKKFGITYPSMITHPRTLWGIETPKTLPATYFISPNGEIVFASLKPQDEASLSLVYEGLQNGV
ncbi:TlpA disulfide reductase family protein [Gammaproteobacteria bacterium]|nr:TlpA disulfide reductase family protein [Gammaproteobacteria bacterium]MDC1131960.1 TlpA disulfide reductase family protein [Gammaproteobacteria bacterium]